MQIWEMTKAEFFEHLTPKGTNPLGFDGVAESFEGQFDPSISTPLAHAPGFAFQVISGAIVAFDIATESVAGFILEEGFAATSPHLLGKNIGSGLVSAAFNLKQWGPGQARDVTAGGYALLEKTHRLEVEAALRRGDPVPKAVREDYP